ncbi:ABC transporter permease [Acuticoccus sediminis]|uniref:ABC transporter permease n=1 Tax=Acuticoccus sediminis TaxID=2184697 RepID=A0A8B2NPJ3_9HYPH|nr:ABC transporter permease [Acuticoccus sediminis]RAI01806.1 ABC transporter permease [Acuticoccus sediminis]
MTRSRSFRHPLALGLAWVVVAFLVLPLLVVVPVSFTDQRYLSMPGEALSLRHWARVFGDPVWRGSILQSLCVGAVSALLATGLGTLCAIGCWRLGTRTAEIVRLVMLTPIIVPSVVQGMAFYRTFAHLGLIDTYAGVILSHTILGLPYVVIIVSAALANVDVRLEQAARSLGASMGKAVTWVLVPLLRPAILSSFVVAFVVSWDEIVVLLFITSRRVHLLPRAMWDGINENVDPAVAAVATLLIAATATALVLRLTWAGFRSGKR